MKEINSLTQLFKYDLWANKKIAPLLRVQDSPSSEQMIQLFAHIRASQQHWYQRIKGRSKTEIVLWPRDSSPSSDLAKLAKMNEKWLILIDQTHDDLNRNISYKKSTGQEFNTPLKGILHHLIIHGQHHRAQIATLLRQDNIEPPGTDFIFYLRATDKT